MSREQSLAMHGYFLALANYNEAKENHDKARKDCDRSWGYFGSRYIDALNKAEHDLEDALRKIMREEVRKLIGMETEEGSSFDL
jgi:hypothetical protein